MGKVFNVTGDCKPDLHYMVNIDKRLEEIRKLVDAGAYFTINRARQYGKTTTLRALSRYLQGEYYVVSLDFQMFDDEKFKNGNVFSVTFARFFLRALKRNRIAMNEGMETIIAQMNKAIVNEQNSFSLTELFENLSDICDESGKPIVLLIDEVDSASNNQVFLDFLAQLRAYYIDRDIWPTFQSVILAGVYDVKNLKRKLRPEEEYNVNSPWNIATDFSIDMSLSKDGISEMLQEYESDHHTEMNIDEMAGMLYDYTSGYPFLVSRLCKLMDEEVGCNISSEKNTIAWTKAGFYDVVKILLSEKNTLFESLIGKLTNFPELNSMLKSLLFAGKNIAYNPDLEEFNIAMMFGFVKNEQGVVTIANRIFETRLYNFYLSSAEMQNQQIYKEALLDKNQFIVDGHLNMQLILEKFVIHFNDLYGNRDETFIEDEGRKYFLLYLRPIINGTGNYYIESQTRSLGQTDVIVDYHGEQYVIEMKIWHGDAYNKRGEAQLVGYLDDYHIRKGYMVSFNFNQKKKIGVNQITVGDKTIVEACV